MDRQRRKGAAPSVLLVVAAVATTRDATTAAISTTTSSSNAARTVPFAAGYLFTPPTWRQCVNRAGNVRLRSRRFASVGLQLAAGFAVTPRSAHAPRSKRLVVSESVIIMGHGGRTPCLAVDRVIQSARFKSHAAVDKRQHARS